MIEITDKIRKDYERYIDDSMNFELEYVIEEWKEKLQTIGFGYDVKIFYNVGFSQSDFAYAIGYLHVPSFIKHHKMGNYYKLWMTKYNNEWCGEDARVKHFGRNSYHIDFSIDYFMGCPWKNDEQENKFYEQMESIKEFIEEKVNDYFFDIYYELSNHVQYLYSDDAIAEWLTDRIENL